MTSQTPAMLAAIITDRDQTIASLRGLLKAKDDEIADLKRDCSRLRGRTASAVTSNDWCHCHPGRPLAGCQNPGCQG